MPSWCERDGKRTKGGVESEMYSRKTQGWLKHIDCILLDVLCLHMAFVLAYMTQHGFSSPYRSSPYLNLAMDLHAGGLSVADRQQKHEGRAEKRIL